MNEQKTIKDLFEDRILEEDTEIFLWMIAIIVSVAIIAGIGYLLYRFFILFFKKANVSEPEEKTPEQKVFSKIADFARKGGKK